MRTEYRHDTAKGVRVLLYGVALSALSAGLLVVGLVETGPERLVLLGIGGIGLALFGAATLVITWRTLRSSELIAVTADGIALPGVGLLPWREVAEVRVDEVRGQRMLGIYPSDPDATIARLPLRRRWLARLNMSMGFAPLSVPENASPVPLEEIVAAIRRHARR